MNKKIWSKHETKQLIARYKENPILWNPKVSDYNNLAKKRKIENNLSDEFNTTVFEIGRKIRILRTQWLKEFKKMCGTHGKEYESKWKWYKPLQPIFDLNRRVIEDASDDSSTDTHLVEVQQEDDKYLHITEDSMCKDEGELSEVDTDNEDCKSLSNDEYQIFGNYVADSLRSMHYENNIQDLKRLIQKHIVRCKEKDDKEYFSIF